MVPGGPLAGGDNRKGKKDINHNSGHGKKKVHPRVLPFTVLHVE